MTSPQPVTPFVAELTEEMRQRFAIRRVVAAVLVRTQPGLDHRFRQKLIGELSEGLYAREVRFLAP